ncbi:MAG: hypothetical protein ACRED0_01330 [Gammaproteobacteria bacterium]
MVYAIEQGADFIAPGVVITKDGALIARCTITMLGVCYLPPKPQVSLDQ